MGNAVLVDTGPLVAMLAANDEHHDVCVAETRNLPSVLSTCWPAITEAAYLLRGYPEGVKALLSRIRLGSLLILPLSEDDIPGIEVIAEKYRDQRFDLTDVCLMYLAEREDIEIIFTVDRRDFSVFRTASGKALHVVPS